MTGQILAGASPFTAIKYQISIMLAIFSIRGLSLLLTTFVIN
ncbi:ABC transporter permease [Psychrilyobacter sp.]